MGRFFINEMINYKTDERNQKILILKAVVTGIIYIFTSKRIFIKKNIWPRKTRRYMTFPKN